MKSFLIIGLGSFGCQLCRQLADQRCDIMIVDKESEKVEAMLPCAVSAKIANCTNRSVLESFDIPSFDAVFVCIGEDFQSSLEITSLVKELGARKVFSKAENDIHEKFLLRNGADVVLYPERDLALNIAVSESSDSIIGCIELDPSCSLVEIAPFDKWIGKSLKELNFRNRYNLSVLAVKKGATVSPISSADYVFRKDEHILMFGGIAAIKELIQ